MAVHLLPSSTMMSRTNRAALFSAPLLAIAVLATPSAARADDADAIAFFGSRAPIALVTLSAGFGTPAGKAGGDGKGGPSEGGIGTLAARLELESPSPLWLSLGGRTYPGAPLQTEVDANVGYAALRQFRGYVNKTGTRELERLELRPFVGVEYLRFANSPDVPTVSGATVLRGGLDLLLMDSAGFRGVSGFNFDAAALLDVTRGEAGIEGGVRDHFAMPGVLGGGFIGGRIGYLPATGGFGLLEIGAAWEVGR